MESGGYKVEGLKAAIKNLQAIGVPAGAIKEAGQKSATIVSEEAKAIVPIRSGKLRRSIKPRKLLNEVKVSAGGTSVPYANLIHWGSKRRGVNKNPFLYRALNFNRKQVLEIYTDELDKLIREHSTKVVKK